MNDHGGALIVVGCAIGADLLYLGASQRLLEELLMRGWVGCLWGGEVCPKKKAEL